VSDTQVLIAGAGPTGLVLALWLNRLGVRVRVVDKCTEPGTASRALVVHARTLEFYRQVGIADDVVRGGLNFVGANLWVRGRKMGRAEFGSIGQGLSPFPYMVVYPQDLHERLLIERLADEGVRVERPTELLAFEEIDGGTPGVRARLRLADGSEETCDADYLAGCDGARSRVRDLLDIGFPGGTYDRLFYVADVNAAGPVMNRELNVVLDTADFLAVFPLPADGHARLIGSARATLEADDLGPDARPERMTWGDVGKSLLQKVRIDVRRVNWFSTYRVHHRVAGQFRRGRAFLLGDAAHIHSPVGGQGMNTGIGDAVNLAWKLASVLDGRADARLLDTYEPERIAFARRLVATTDRAFTIITKPGRFARFVRVGVAPRLLPFLFRRVAFRRLMFRTVSQIAVRYRDSWLSDGEAGRVRGGDRLPWVRNARGTSDNFEPLTSLDWQAHVYGHASVELTDLCARRGPPLHVFAWSEDAGRAGLKCDALYLVRPDGYVALVDARGSAARLEAYLDTRALCVRPHAGAELRE
jgi:2-polyprenyl-6-methoxyphenol hydroxylase-like FAD-dependent oxidoreductase